MNHRITLLLALGLFGLGCSTNDGTAPSGSDAAADAAPDLCDIDAFTGSGNACPRVSDRRCFAECDTGGCKCTQGATGPVWKCTADVSCLPDAGPLDDAGADDAAMPDDAGDAGVGDAGVGDASAE